MLSKLLYLGGEAGEAVRASLVFALRVEHCSTARMSSFG